jgi:bifunctional UDP-N-acetylglucosamine pyrophosphorylase/glucosamine-1-phosphate N-acetyltransferase
MNNDTTLCIVPAAGKGTRLGLDVPKIMAPLGKDYIIWDILYSKLMEVSDHIYVVISPWGKSTFLNYIQKRSHQAVDVVVQAQPIGMGDAVFNVAPYFQNARNVLIVWGDQVNVSNHTLKLVRDAHGGRKRTVVIPTVVSPFPYVEYVFSNGNLLNILETREGAKCTPNGYTDIGTFMLSAEGLVDAWHGYTSLGVKGAMTGEINFLPFLCYLSQIGWNVIQIIIEDFDESRGVNTQDDLQFAAQKLQQEIAKIKEFK